MVLLHSVYLGSVIAHAAGHGAQSMLQYSISPIASYLTVTMVFDFLLTPYWFTNVLIATPISLAMAYQDSSGGLQGLVRALSLGVRLEKELYIAQVAHDIGTPLTTFSLGLQLLREDPDMTSDMLQVLDMQWEWSVDDAVAETVKTDFSWIQVVEDGKWLRFTVRDFGRGVSPAYARTLFEKYT
ncbi:hypothetical protein JKP88DRAFT_283354 [Tribonema minus]|uniref:Uncharacterized protein n=1 Tax=Tribonema minus TaxID=303371 RepID=A0A835YRK3_9STRA|nr:hypothetical protein JKP88DRAFT_283354 [Tribonema minus]